MAGGIGAKLAVTRIRGVAGCILHDEEAATLNGCIQRTAGILDRTLREVASGHGAADARADLQGRGSFVHGVFKKHRVGLEALRVRVRDVVADDVQRLFIGEHS